MSTSTTFATLTEARRAAIQVCEALAELPEGALHNEWVERTREGARELVRDLGVKLGDLDREGWYVASFAERERRIGLAIDAGWHPARISLYALNPDPEGRHGQRVLFEALSATAREACIAVDAEVARRMVGR